MHLFKRISVSALVISSMATGIQPASSGAPLALSGNSISVSFNKICFVTPSGSNSCPREGGSSIASQISTSDTHACIVTIAKEVECWGDNQFGQIDVPNGLNGVTQIEVAPKYSCAIKRPSDFGSIICWGFMGHSIPENPGSIDKISLSQFHMCSLSSGGKIACAGDNSFGQSNVPSSLEYAVDIETGMADSCSLDIKGKVKCWGSSPWSSMVPPSNLANVVDVELGSMHACTLTLDQKMRCWGDNSYGQTMVPSGLPPVNQIALGAVTTCVVLESSEVRCWGKSLTNSPSAGSRAALLVHLSEITSLNISGDATLGNTLTADWGLLSSMENVKLAWYSQQVLHGEFNAKTHVVTFEDLGRDLQVYAFVAMRGNFPLIATTSATKVEKIGPQLNSCGDFKPHEITVASMDASNWRYTDLQPLLSGENRYGQKLSVSNGRWLEKLRFCVVWFANDKIVSASNAGAYFPKANDIGKRVRAVVIGIGDRVSTFRFTEGVDVAKGSFANVKAPAIKGTLKVGKSVAASYKPWDSGTRYTFQWLRNGRAIRGAVKSIYRLGSIDRRASLSLRMCGFKPSYEDICLTSKSSRVG